MRIINFAGIDGVVDRIQDIYSLAVGSIVGVVAILILSLLFCFLGFRLTRFVSAVGGAVIGGSLCAFVASTYLPDAIASLSR